MRSCTSAVNALLLSIVLLGCAPDQRARPEAQRMLRLAIPSSWSIDQVLEDGVVMTYYLTPRESQMDNFREYVAIFTAKDPGLSAQAALEKVTAAKAAQGDVISQARVARRAGHPSFEYRCVSRKPGGLLDRWYVGILHDGKISTILFATTPQDAARWTPVFEAIAGTASYAAAPGRGSFHGAMRGRPVAR